LNGDTSVIAQAMRQALGAIVGLESAMVGLEPAVAGHEQVVAVSAELGGEAWRPPQDDAEVLDDSIQGT
jgi:hypothetical protein